jgi:hypothetical protein
VLAGEARSEGAARKATAVLSDTTCLGVLMLWGKRQPRFPSRPERGRLFHVWRWTKRVVGVLAVLAAVSLALAPAITNHLVERERDRIRAAGEPLTCADLVQSLPTGTPNAADVYLQAFDALDRTEEEEELIGLWSAQELAPEWIESMRAVVEKNEEYFALLEEAAGMETCVFPVEWERRADAEERHLGHLRTTVRMVTARALVLASDGNADEALESCALIPAAAQHLSDEPVMVGQLVRYAIISMGIRAVEQVLNRRDPSPEACRELYDRMAEVELSESLIYALRGERAFTRECLFDTAREVASEARGWAAYLIYAELNIDERLCLRAMDEQMEALQLPWPAAKREADAVLDRVSKLPASVYTLSTSMMPRFGLVAELCRLTGSRLDVCRIGLALRAYQAEHGRYPDYLDDLAQAGWAVPADSFTGEPYHYRLEGNGFIVWGVGRDLDDDGGKRFRPVRSRTQSEKENDYDVVFRCER